MHVEVTKMRRAGQKLAEQDRDKPLIGFLSIDYWHLVNGREDRWIRSITLRPTDNGYAAPSAQMNDVDLKELRKGYMLFIGDEMVHPDTFKQAWLVRPLTDGEKCSIQRRELGLDTPRS